MNEPVELAPSPCDASEAVLGFSMRDAAFNQIAVLVLAGGDGQRMGGGKPLRLLAGQPLIAHALVHAQRFGALAAFGVRAVGQLGGAFEAECVIDAPGFEGPLASVAAGLAWAAGRGKVWLLTLPCDAPFLPCDLAKRLVAAAMGEGAAVALPKSAGRLHPACGLWSSGLVDRVREYAGSGRSSLMGFAETCGFTSVEWPTAEGDPFFNVNTPAELAAAEARPSQPHLE
jgi:molybdenum cofactor guanylyltransferase